MPTYDFDLFVIGGGSGGVRAARMAAQMGARVALAECAELGGTCVNVGCIPKKLYSYAAGYAEAFEESSGYGWSFDTPPSFDWGELKANRAREIHRLNGVYQGLLDGAGVRLVQGFAQLEDAHTVRVAEASFTARHILIATGGMPFVPEVTGRELGVVSDDMFDLEPFPKRLLVVGGGYIACEMASIFNGLGAQVSLLQRTAHLLNGFDEDVRVFLAREMSRTGVELMFNSEISMISRIDGGLCALLARGQRVEVDAVLFATGRVPNTAALGLEAVGVTLDARGGVVVDADYRSSVPSVLAVGDVCTRQPLTPVALAEAMVVVDHLFGSGKRRLDYEFTPTAAAKEMVVVDHLFGSGKRRLDYEFTPTAVFTHPNIGTCGHTEAAARARFGDVRIFSSEFKALRHTLSQSQERCFMKLVVDKATDRVVGLHMVGPDAGEIVQGFAVAMRMGATKADFDATIGIHPTVAEEFVTMRTPMPG